MTDQKKHSQKQKENLKRLSKCADIIEEISQSMKALGFSEEETRTHVDFILSLNESEFLMYISALKRIFYLEHITRDVLPASQIYT